ncbi:Uncharacterised protein [Vibrio cholerae]|nr:Uncharacterised protein [Vibrio cholerae]
MRCKTASVFGKAQSSVQKAAAVPLSPLPWLAAESACHFSSWKWCSVASAADLYRRRAAFRSAL